MTSWLHKHKKQQIIDLSSEAGLDQDPSLRKDELIDALEEHLQANATSLSNNDSFQSYYGVKRTPGRPRGTSMAPPPYETDDGDVKSVVRGRGRRPTRVKQEPESDNILAPSSPVRALAASTAALTGDPATVPTRTPGRPRRSQNPNPNQTTLPASPSHVADYAEDQAHRFSAGLNDMISLSGVPEILHDLRSNLSSVPAIILSCLALETWGIFDAILPWKYTGLDIPIPLYGRRLHPHIWAVKLPDLFLLLQLETFWKPLLLWLTTSILLPTLFGAFYNLTIRDVKRGGARVQEARYRVDPMVFCVVKVLVQVLVYGNGIFFGGVVDEVAAETVHGAVFGGWQGMATGAGIGALASLWEGVQRR